MRLLLHCAILAGAFAAAAPAYADTYKWIDDNGVTNYSDAPPSARASKAQVVADRVSVVASDPSLAPAIAAFRAQAARQEELDEADWLQRQRLMLAEKAADANASCPYRADCGAAVEPIVDSYFPYAPVFVVGAARRFHRPFMRGSADLRHVGGGAMRSLGGTFR
jgi:Domain of unknown function (DUF4124)